MSATAPGPAPAPSIPDLLLKALDRRGLPHWKLARHLERHPGTVSRWLSGEVEMPADLVVRASAYLQAPELREALLERHPWVRSLIGPHSNVMHLDIERQRRAMRHDEAAVPVEARLYPGSRIEIVLPAAAFDPNPAA